MDIAGVAVHLGVSLRHVRKLVAQRRIPYVKWENLLLAIWTQRNYLRPIDDEEADLGAIAGVVVFIGGGFILIDFLVDTLDASLDPRVRDVRA